MTKLENREADCYFKAFPTNLRKIIEQKGLTQAEIGAALGRTRQAIATYMSGKSSPDWETIAALSKLLGVSSDWLLGLSDKQTSEPKVKEACELMGVSEKTINAIHAFTHTYDATSRSNLMEHIFCDSNFVQMLEVFEQYYNARSLHALLDDMGLEVSEAATIHRDQFESVVENRPNNSGIIGQLDMEYALSKAMEGANVPIFPDNTWEISTHEIIHNFVVQTFYTWLGEETGRSKEEEAFKAARAAMQTTSLDMLKGIKAFCNQFSKKTPKKVVYEEQETAETGK